jgi:hypothetical protein
MSAVGRVLRSALARAAGAVSLNKAAATPATKGWTNRCGTPAGRRAETGPPAGSADDDTLDRERQLRVLMSSWM